MIWNLSEIIGCFNHLDRRYRLKSVRNGMVLMVVCLLVACNHKPLVYPVINPQKVHVGFDWMNQDNSEVAGMSVAFFPVKGESNSIWRFELSGVGGGDVEVPPGRYNIIFYNYDVVNVYIGEKDSSEKIKAYTLSSVLNLPGTSELLFEQLDNIQIFKNPGKLYGGIVENVEIRNKAGIQEIICFPTLRTGCVRVDVIESENTQGIAAAYGLLTGLSDETGIAYGSLSSKDATQGFTFAVKDENLAGKFPFFGRSKDDKVVNTLYLLVVMGDKQTAMYKFDVTQQVVNSFNPLDVHILLKGVHFPESAIIPPEPPHGGFEAEVDDWESIITNILVSG